MLVMARGVGTMKIRRVRSLSEYCLNVQRSRIETESGSDFEASLEHSRKDAFTVRGFFYPAGKGGRFSG